MKTYITLSLIILPFLLKSQLLTEEASRSITEQLLSIDEIVELLPVQYYYSDNINLEKFPPARCFFFENLEPHKFTVIEIEKPQENYVIFNDLTKISEMRIDTYLRIRINEEGNKVSGIIDSYSAVDSVPPFMLEAKFCSKNNELSNVKIKVFDMDKLSKKRGYWEKLEDFKYVLIDCSEEISNNNKESSIIYGDWWFIANNKYSEICFLDSTFYQMYGENINELSSISTYKINNDSIYFLAHSNMIEKLVIHDKNSFSTVNDSIQIIFTRVKGKTRLSTVKCWDDYDERTEIYYSTKEFEDYLKAFLKRELKFLNNNN